MTDKFLAKYSFMNRAYGKQDSEYRASSNINNSLKLKKYMYKKRRLLQEQRYYKMNKELI